MNVVYKTVSLGDRHPCPWYHEVVHLSCKAPLYHTHSSEKPVALPGGPGFLPLPRWRLDSQSPHCGPRPAALPWPFALHPESSSSKLHRSQHFLLPALSQLFTLPSGSLISFPENPLHRVKLPPFLPFSSLEITSPDEFPPELLLFVRQNLTHTHTTPIFLPCSPLPKRFPPICQPIYSPHPSL